MTYILMSLWWHSILLKSKNTFIRTAYLTDNNLEFSRKWLLFIWKKNRKICEQHTSGTRHMLVFHKPISTHSISLWCEFTWCSVVGHFLAAVSFSTICSIVFLFPHSQHHEILMDDCWMRSNNINRLSLRYYYDKHQNKLNTIAGAK